MYLIKAEALTTQVLTIELDFDLFNSVVEGEAKKKKKKKKTNFVTLFQKKTRTIIITHHAWVNFRTSFIYNPSMFFFFF